MNKRELAKAVAVQADTDLSTTSRVLEAFTEVVTAVVAKGEPVAVSGFCKFVKRDLPARMGRNPATGEQIRIKASKKARITPYKVFKDSVLNPSQAPKLARGVFPTDDAAVKAAGKSAVAAKATAKKAPARKKAAARKAPARKKAAARKAPARRKAAARKAPARRKAAARKAPARKATRRR